MRQNIEAAKAYLTYYPSKCLEELRKTKKNSDRIADMCAKNQIQHLLKQNRGATNSTKLLSRKTSNGENLI
jgi:hypothetical protein